MLIALVRVIVVTLLGFLFAYLYGLNAADSIFVSRGFLDLKLHLIPFVEAVPSCQLGGLVASVRWVLLFHPFVG